jgi:hypothetical protein
VHLPHQLLLIDVYAFIRTYCVFLCEEAGNGMAAMVGLRTDWALTEDDECLR